MRGFWTDERIAVIRRVAAEGGSFSDAGRELGVSRNAVAGKAYREGVRFDGLPERRSEVGRENIAKRWGARPCAS